MKSKRIMALALILLIALQCVVYVSASKDKQYLHTDEVYSLGLAQYHNKNIQGNHDFYGNWHGGDYYKSYLVVDNYDVNNTEPVYKNQVENNNPPFYYFFLRFYMEFSVGQFSMMTSIVLNIMVYALTTLMMYFIAKRLFGGSTSGNWMAFLATAVASLVLSTVSSVLFTDAYAMLTLHIVMLMFLYIKQYESGSPNAWIAILIALVIACGYLTHYSFIIFLASIYLFMTVRYIIKKQYKDIIWHTIPVIFGVGAGIYIFPESVDHIKYILAQSKIFAKLSDTKQLTESIKGYIGGINRYTFHLALYLILGVIAACVVVMIIKSASKNGDESKEVVEVDSVDEANEAQESTLVPENNIEGEKEVKKPVKFASASIILIPTLIYFIISAALHPTADIKYIYPICGFIFILIAGALVWALNKAFGKIPAISAFVAVLAIILVLPTCVGLKAQHLYEDYTPVLEYVEENKNIPVLYAFDTSDDQLIDTLYLLTKFESSYITRDWDINTSNMSNVFARKDISRGVIVMINANQDDEYILNTIKSTLGLKEFEYVMDFKGADIYYISN